MSPFTQRLHALCVNLGVTPPLIICKDDPEWSHLIMFLDEYGITDIRMNVIDDKNIVLCHEDIRDTLKHSGIHMVLQTIFSNPRKLKIKVC